MLKITHSNFELDLSNYAISIVEENNWFSDRFFTQFTLPFKFKITDELNIAFGDILSYTTAVQDTYFEVYFYHNGKEYEAIFEIEEIEGREATANVRFGLEELPNYNKKLSELPLDDYEILAPNTIYSHATDTITKTWPEVTHNFVQVHTDAFDTSTDQWQFFEGTINKRIGGSFVTNEYNAENDLQLNRNILMPQPYLLYVLQKAVEDAGFTIAGEILEDTDLKKALFSEISNYYYTINTSGLEVNMHSGEYNFENSFHYRTFRRSKPFTEKGRYKIAGNITLRYFTTGAWSRIKVAGNYIYDTGSWGATQFKERVFSIDLNFDYFTGASINVVFESYQFGFKKDGDEFLDNQPIFDLTITQISKLDTNGDLLPTLIFPNHIKLNKCVPDMTVGDFITTLKNWKNLDVNPVDKTIYFNFIETQLTNETSVDLSMFEVKEPRRLYSQGKSFLLKFQDISTNDFDYTFESIFVDVNGATTNYKQNDDTAEIAINAIPLPRTTRNNIITAHHFLDEASKLKVILYEGAVDIDNVAEDAASLLIPNVYENHFKNWFNFRINSQGFLWNFKMTEEALHDISLREKLFAYKNYHIIKNLNKDLIRPGLWLVEIETESLKHSIE